ncbi:histidinol-phosphate transaminase [Alteromonas pelagimontana]|uniref:Histidinol-phosphate aminotransferase n=1 Tax=Alteromonas pelagimontana TaxID=1858656 RepID=A0A6M4MGU9_9ALTE|nr:histidinol-phosphate transaminase [Alteromonas pelagimontana]QJR82187.1 histidinol-phosphate transaminase [Alteromonas pelagimontana]
MSQLVNRLINANLAALKPYESARRLFSGGQDWLNANESPFTNPYEIDSDHFNRYPSCQPAAVINGYAAYAQVDSEQVLVTRGADEGIELLIRTFCQPGQDNILICPPTYGMYAISAETCNVGVKRVPLQADFRLDVPAICAEDDVKLVFICSPNNPTGTTVDQGDLLTIVKHFADTALVVVDEAYIEFAMDATWANALASHPNLVILRTLSKAFALAGLRCGFTLASPAIIQALLKVIAPYPVPEPVAQIAAQALTKENIERLRAQTAFLNSECERLKQELARRRGIELLGDTKANFILFRYAGSSELMQYLVSEGMLIRDQSKQYSLNQCLRVTAGNEAQNNRLLQLIDHFIAQTGVSA